MKTHANCSQNHNLCAELLLNVFYILTNSTEVLDVLLDVLEGILGVRG